MISLANVANGARDLLHGLGVPRPEPSSTTDETDVEREPTKSDALKAAKADADMRTAPDPLAAILPALAALGAVASIAAINWVAQDRTADRSRTRRKAGMALRDLESCCLGLQEVFKRFLKHPKLFGGEGASTTAPIKFGVYGPRVEPDTARLYQQLVSEVASMLVLAAHNSFEAMSAIEDGEIDAPEQIYFGFGEQQERLNKLLIQRAGIKPTVETGLDIAVRLTELVRELKKHKIE